jgi:transcriptional regulator GlxA family with amidase domain
MPLDDRATGVAQAQSRSASSELLHAEQGSRIDERHYSVAELAERWNLSPDTIRKLFENEPGVLMLGESLTRRGKRRYTTLRIPASVAARVHRRLSKV